MYDYSNMGYIEAHDLRARARVALKKIRDREGCLNAQGMLAACLFELAPTMCDTGSVRSGPFRQLLLDLERDVKEEEKER